jgi:hypothetical protein
MGQEVGLWVFSLVCDLVLFFGGTSENWAIVARYTWPAASSAR